MKTLFTILFSLIAVVAFSQQRQFTSAQVATINADSTAAGGDLYHDTEADILYIGLMTGKLVAIKNTDSQDLNLVGNTLSLSNDGSTVDLTPYVNTDNQDLSLAGNTLSLTNDGTTVDLSPYINTDNQDLSLAGNTLSLSNDGTTVDLTPYVNTDNQDLSLAGNTLSLSNDGTTVDLTPYVNTDNQDLSLSGNTLSLTNDGTTVDLSPYINTDNQTLTYTNSDPDDNINTLQITGSSAFNIADNHLGTNNQTLTGARTVTLNSNSLTFDGTQDVIIEADGDMGIGTITPAAKLDVDNGSVRFSDYGIGTYLDTLVSVDKGVHLLAADAQGDIVETNSYKASRVFYPPAVVIDVSAVSSDETIDLYQEYLDRMGSPGISSTANPIPIYSRTELEYHVLDWDTSVFNIGAGDLSTGGVLTYDVISVPSNNCTYINVVFVVK